MDESTDLPGRGAGRGREHAVPDPVEALADLESQAAAWSRDERAAEVVDRAAEAYRSVTLAGRLVAGLGREVSLDLGAAGVVRGRLDGAGDGWAVVDDAAPLLVLSHAVCVVGGLGQGSAAPAAWPLGSRLTVATVLQRVAQPDGELQLTTRDGVRRRGRGTRVGADFLELRTGDGTALLLPFAGLAAVRRV